MLLGAAEATPPTAPRSCAVTLRRLCMGAALHFTTRGRRLSWMTEPNAIARRKARAVGRRVTRENENSARDSQRGGVSGILMRYWLSFPEGRPRFRNRHLQGREGRMDRRRRPRERVRRRLERQARNPLPGG
jgi:hypothetical protein